MLRALVAVASISTIIAADFPSTTMTDSNYQTMLGAKGVQVVYASAVWSGPARIMNPSIASLPFEPSQLTLWRLDVDECPKASTALKVVSVPTIIIFRDGKEVKRLSGAVPKSALETFIRSALP